MDPFSIMAVVAIASALFGAYSSYEQGREQKKMYEYNAELARRQAEEARQQAQYQAERFREQGEGLKARQRLAFNVSGVTPEGTPTETLMDTAKKLELDAQAILYGGQSKYAAGIEQATLLQMQGGAAQRAGW